MMNKNRNVIDANEINIFKYELSKIKNAWLKVFLITTVIQLLSFMFFSVVGKLDGSADTISSFQGIIALSTTVSMCGISIYGAVLMRKELVIFYVAIRETELFYFLLIEKFCL